MMMRAVDAVGTVENAALAPEIEVLASVLGSLITDCPPGK